MHGTHEYFPDGNDDEEEPPQQALELAENVTAKLCEWSDPKTRLEKKKIQKQVVNQHCREWLQDVVLLEPADIAVLAKDDNEVAALKRDHAKYVRKAVFDEYTFKKKPKVKRKVKKQNVFTFSWPMLNIEAKKDIDGKEKIRAGEGILRELIRLGFETGDKSRDESDDSKYENISDSSSYQRPWHTTDGLGQSIIPLTKDRDRNIDLLTRSLVKEVLQSSLKSSASAVIELLKSGMLLDAILPILQELVNESVKRVKEKVPVNDHKWLNELADQSRAVAQQIEKEILEEATFAYFERIVIKHFINEYLVPISDSIVKKYVKKNPTIVTTNFNRNLIKTYVKRELMDYEEFHIVTKIAANVAKLVSEDVFAVFSINIVIPQVPSEPSVSEVGIETKYANRMAELTKKAELQARKILQYLKDPDTAKRDINKSHATKDKYTGKKDNCRCAKISKLGGKKDPFVLPHHKIKSNYYFYNKYISDANKNQNPVTLYPKTQNTIKLVCDDNWRCIPVPLERELRDIPYRFSYAPPYVLEQIKKTKSIKASDGPMICNIMNNIENNRKSVDSTAIVRKILADQQEKLETLPPVSGESVAELSHSSDRNRSSVTKVTTSKSGSTVKLIDGLDNKKSSSKAFNTLSRSMSRITNKTSLSDSIGMRGAVPAGRKISGHAFALPSRESQVPKAPRPPPYYKYLVEGYKYEMIPMTPCRFHSLKNIKSILKRFETAGGDAALEYHFETPKEPVNIDELLPIPRLVDAFGQWKKHDEETDSPWTRALNDSRLKRMARFRKIYRKDPVFGFMSNWESSHYKCKT